jgi:GT2 family glycosyltransferase
MLKRYYVLTHIYFFKRLPYEKIFGGVTEFRREQFEKINGFSNLFFGWGGEDDDIRERVVKKGYSIARYPLEIGRYYMASHSKDKPNPER